MRIIFLLKKIANLVHLPFVRTWQPDWLVHRYNALILRNWETCFSPNWSSFPSRVSLAEAVLCLKELMYCINADWPIKLVNFSKCWAPLELCGCFRDGNPYLCQIIIAGLQARKMHTGWKVRWAGMVMTSRSQSLTTPWMRGYQASRKQNFGKGRN